MALVLRRGGRLVAQCGGKGNIAAVVQAIAATGEQWTGPWTFATPEDTARHLEAAGFTEVRTWLHEEPVALEAGDALREYLRTVILGSHLERLPADQREAFVDAVAAGLPTPTIDYVRLNIVAVKGR
jgi:trans-aconitate 2-methyltransferase